MCFSVLCTIGSKTCQPNGLLLLPNRRNKKPFEKQKKVFQISFFVPKGHPAKKPKKSQQRKPKARFLTLKTAQVVRRADRRDPDRDPLRRRKTCLRRKRTRNECSSATPPDHQEKCRVRKGKRPRSPCDRSSSSRPTHVPKYPSRAPRRFFTRALRRRYHRQQFRKQFLQSQNKIRIRSKPVSRIPHVYNVKRTLAPKSTVVLQLPHLYESIATRNTSLFHSKSCIHMTLDEIQSDMQRSNEPKSFVLEQCPFCHCLRDVSENNLCCLKGKRLIGQDLFPDWSFDFRDLLGGITDVGEKSRELNNLCNFSSIGTAKAGPKDGTSGFLYREPANAQGACIPRMWEDVSPFCCFEICILTRRPVFLSPSRGALCVCDAI